MKTIIEFSKFCDQKIFDKDEDRPISLQRKISFRVVIAKPSNELGTFTGPIQAGAYQLVDDGPMSEPMWLRVRNTCLDMPGYRGVALPEETVIGLVMVRLVDLASSQVHLPCQPMPGYMYINLGELA